MLCLLTVAAALAPVLAPHDPLEIAEGGGLTLERPTRSHPFGTDALGRDLLARVLWAGRVSLAVGVGVELLVATLGCLVGLAAGYYGGALDGVLMRVTDVVMAFPSLVLAIGLIAVFERPGLDKVVLVLVTLGWTTIARVVRGTVLTLKEREFVQAARALGAGGRSILFRHLLPNALGPLLVAATLGVGQQHDRGGRSLVPGPRRPVADAVLGRAPGRRPDVPRHRPLGGRVPRPGPAPRRPRGQPPRRRPSRSPRPAVPLADLVALRRRRAP